MKYYEICFSPTGGTQKVVDAVAKGLVQSTSKIDLTDAKGDFDGISLTKEDVALIAVPSYSGRVPETAAARIARLQGHGASAILICVYGNRAYEDTLVELQDIAHRARFKVVAAVAAVAEHSIARRYAAGRPDEEDRTQLTEFARQIAQKIASGETCEPKIPGHRPYRKAGATGIVPKPTKACRNCGVCARKCPVGAINPTDSQKVDKKACISCMRCVAVCPHFARKINRFLLFLVNAMLKKACSQRKANELYL